MPIIRVGFDRKAWMVNNPTYGSDFTGGKFYSADSEYSVVWSAGKAFDNGELTSWCSANTALPHWVQVDLGSGVTKTARKLRIKPYSGISGKVKDFKLQGSNDGSTWADIYTDQTENNAKWQEFTFNNSTAYRYYRLYATTNHDSTNYACVTEIELMEAV